MKTNNFGIKFALILAALHLCLAILAYVSVLDSKSSTAGLVYLWFFFSDAPILFIPQEFFKLFGKAHPLVQFGVFGSGLWLGILLTINKLTNKFSPQASNAKRTGIFIASIIAILFGFSFLAGIYMDWFQKSQRPAELTQLDAASSDYLKERVVYESGAYDAGIKTISYVKCRNGASNELLLTTGGDAVYLDNQYQEVSRVNLRPDLNGRFFNRTEPVEDTNQNSCKYLAYSIFDSAYILNDEGLLLWKSADKSNGKPTGAANGDVDGDGKPEIILYHRYREGIHLYNLDGKLIWKQPVYSFGTLAIENVIGDEVKEVIYSNSNNANGKTTFTVLGAKGAVLQELKLQTHSSEFVIISWPDKNSDPHILLTEEKKIRLVDFSGKTVLELDAPGSRPFGKVSAVTVRLAKDKPRYIAVRKKLHPDLMVLFVYDHTGKLVYQKTEVTKAVPHPVLYALPDNDAGVERLLIASDKGNQSILLEYSLNKILN